MHACEIWRNIIKLKEKEMGGTDAEKTVDCISVLLAILLPPLGVFLKLGLQLEFWICLILTIIAYLPGIVYAVYVLMK